MQRLEGFRTFCLHLQTYFPQYRADSIMDSDKVTRKEEEFHVKRKLWGTALLSSDDPNEGFLTHPKLILDAAQPGFCVVLSVCAVSSWHSPFFWKNESWSKYKRLYFFW